MLRDTFLTNDAFVKIRDMILSYALRPGERLVDRTLAERLGVSRTPVREALARLSESNLVVSCDGRGYFVADVDSKQAEDLYNLREVLEVHSIAEACKHATVGDITEMKSVLRSLDKLRNRPEKIGEKLHLGRMVHELIARSSGNQALYETSGRLLDRMTILVWLEVSHESRESADLAYADHVEMVELIGRKASAESTRLMRRHIRAGKNHIVKILKRREALYKSGDFDKR